MNALDLLSQIEQALPRLRELAVAGDLDGDYWPDIDQAAGLLEALVEAFHDDADVSA